MTENQRLPLHQFHIDHGAKMVPFAGYDMPVQYSAGVMAEHAHTRAAAGLFDVSHMGQVVLRGADYATLAAALETLVPVDVAGLAQGRQRYALFTTPQGGISDDLMFANRGDHIFMVVNAACKAADLAHMQAHLAPMGVSVELLETRALLALQGPRAGDVLARLDPAAALMRFMDVADLCLGGVAVWASRSGYTGEDGFELSVPADQAQALAQILMENPDVALVGLGARDSLRLEAGLCLYGHDITTQTTPIEAGLGWAIQKTRRLGGARAGGFPGADVILAQIENGAPRARVGLRPEGRAPMREGVVLFACDTGDAPIGQITSGGFGPSLGGPVAMGYVPREHATPGTRLWGELRGKRLPLTVVGLPFIPANFKR